MNKAKIYLQEVDAQIQYAKMCFSAYKQAKEDNSIPLIFFHVHHFVVHVANVDKILDPKPSNPRSQILNASIDLTDVDLKKFRHLRNHLEHLDERLDKWIKNHNGAAFFDMNLVEGTQGFPDKAFLRAMDGDIFKFYGEDYDLAELIAQLLEIEERIPEKWRKRALPMEIKPEQNSE